MRVGHQALTRHSGKSVLCPRSVPSTKRRIPSSATVESHCGVNHIKRVFTQPGSGATFLPCAGNVAYASFATVKADVTYFAFVLFATTSHCGSLLLLSDLQIIHLAHFPLIAAFSVKA
jgi:hypothetical protein